jgi:hypothetical protein
MRIARDSMGVAYLDRFVKTVEESDHAVFTGPDEHRRRHLVKYHDDRFDPPLLLDFTEEEFDAAVHATGRDARSLWPDDPEPEAGIKMMLVHLYESMSVERRPRERIYLSNGQLWAE